MKYKFLCGLCVIMLVFLLCNGSFCFVCLLWIALGLQLNWIAYIAIQALSILNLVLLIRTLRKLEDEQFKP